jgi:hypothetical protein
MFRKIINIFETHIEKIVLVIAGIVCIWLFTTHILLNPNTVEYVRNGTTEKVKPSKIDELIYEDAQVIIDKLNGKDVTPIQPYTSRVSDFLKQIDSSMAVNTDLRLPNPDITKTEVTNNTYQLPLPNIGRVTDIAIEHIRTAAYVPAKTITPEQTYDNIKGEPADADIVTVEAKFDLAGLFARFKSSFVDNTVQKLSDPCLAIPLIASVNLQRRQQTENGGWSEWKNVPRSKVDHNWRSSQVAENTAALTPSMLKVQMYQFDDKQFQIELLQPPVYQFASAADQWYPPRLHQKYLTAKDKEVRQERIDAREAETTTSARTGTSTTGTGSRRSTNTYQSTTDTGTTDTGRGSRRSTNTYQSTTDTGTTDSGRGGRRGRGTSTISRRGTGTTDSSLTTSSSLETDAAKPTEEVSEEYTETMLTLNSNFARLKEPVLLWALDDTVEQGQKYQYRIRIGVFNPVFNGSENNAILWSDYSELTQTVEIPRMLYFFATEAQEVAKTATIMVCKYYYGYWRNNLFKVGLGDQIGRVVEYEYDEEVSTITTTNASGNSAAISSTSPLYQAVKPASVDFSTGAVLVDLVRVDDVSTQAGLQNRKYFEILYSNDGGDTIERMPAPRSYWPAAIENRYKLTQEVKVKEPFKAWDSTNPRFTAQ